MANAFGSITIVDMTDVGQFSTVPMSNAGIMMIYDPNALSNNYTPASMTLKPYTIYGGEDLSADTDVTYTWYKRTGNDTFDTNNPGTATSTARTVSVTSADFANNVKNITYYLKASYELPGNINLIAWGQISISLSSQATNIQDIEISGEHIFKYKYTAYGGNPIIDGDTSVDLIVDCTSNVAVHQWYYWNGSATTPSYVAINPSNPPTGITIVGNTCTVTHTANVFTNNKAKFKVTAHRTDAVNTELTSVYDEYEVLKLYDGQIGAPGEGTVVLRLSNEDQMIPCNGRGVPTAHAFDLAYTDIEVIDGGSDVTGSWSISCIPTGVVGSYDSTTHRYTVSDWDSENTSEVGYVTITATKGSATPLTKIMSLTKIKTGEDGKTPTVYQLSLTPNKVTTTYDGKTTAATTLTASVIAHSVNAQTSAATNVDVTTSATDVIYYEWFMNGSPSDSKHGAGSNGYQFTISQGNTVSSVVCKIRKTNSSGTILDSQSVSFTPKGEKGATGATGDGSITLDFPQITDTIGLKNDGTLATDYSIELPYTVYQGSRVLTAQASGTGQTYSINGVTPTFTWGSSKVTITILNGTKLYDATKTGVQAHALNGQFTIPITYTDAHSTNAQGNVTTNVTGTINGTFTWNLDVAPANGTSVTVASTWTRYKQTNSATQPSGSNDITQSDATSIQAAITAGGLSKPYYVWGKTHTQYAPSGTADTYTVNYYPVDPTNGKSVKTTSAITYQTSSSGTTEPIGTWSNSISAATSGKTKPYYLWTKNETTYTYDGGGSAGSNTITYSTSYYPADTYELGLNATSLLFNGTINTIEIQALVSLNGGSYTISNTGSELVWSYAINGAMADIISTTTTDNIYRVDSSSVHKLVVKPDAINGSTTICCKLTKDNKNYYKYLTLEDDTDDFRCELFSTMGDKITNGQGSGFVECILYRNGYEIDKITAGPTITSARVPSGSSPHAAVISTTTEISADPKPAKLQDIQSINYSWKYYVINNDGSTSQITNNTYNASGKAIYMDGSMITKRIMINCDVTINYKTV